MFKHHVRELKQQWPVDYGPLSQSDEYSDDEQFSKDNNKDLLDLKVKTSFM